ncbi:MAG: hypothetical protein WCG52_04870, partial [bacterium]
PFSGDLAILEAEVPESFLEIFQRPSHKTPDAFHYQEFTSELQQEAARRIGRDEELSALCAAIESLPLGGLLWVGGVAGMGKSCLMASATVAMLDSKPAQTLILPYRFKTGGGRCSVGDFLGYATERLQIWGGLDKDAAGKIAESASAQTRFLELLRCVMAGWGVLIMADGLDELPTQDDKWLDEVVVASVRGKSSRTRWALAGRPERGIPQKLRKAGAVEVFPEGLPPMKAEDVRSFFFERLSRCNARNRLISRDAEKEGVIVNPFLREVMRRSEGLPIYMNYVIGDIIHNKITPDLEGQLPQGIAAYHEELLRRCAVGDLQAVMTPLVAVLALAHEPLAPAALASILRSAGRLDTENVPLIEKALAGVSSMIRRSPNPDGVDGYILYHASLREHICATDSFQETIAALRKKLSNFCSEEIKAGGENLLPYVRRHALKHFLEVEDWDSATAALSNLEFIEARALAQELPAMLKDYVEVINSLPKGHCSFDIIKAFRVFVATNVAPLQKYSIQEGFAYNLAINNAPAGPVHKEGKNRLEPLQCAKVIRQFSSSAVFNSLPVCQAILEVGPVASLDQIAVAVNIERRIAVSGYDNGVLNVWNLDSGECVKVLEAHSSTVTSVALSADGLIAVSGYDDGIVKIWNLDSGECIKVLQAHIHEYIDPLNPDWQEMGITSNIESILNDEDRLGIFSGKVSALALSADGRFLVSGSLVGNIRIWHLESGVCLKYLEDHSDAINALAINNNGLIVSGSADQTLRARSRDYKWILNGHTSPVTSLAVSEGGDFVVSGSWDKTLRVWKLDTGERIKILEGHTDFVTSVAVSSDFRMAVSGSKDKTLRVWNLESGECIKVIEGHSDSAFILAISADGRVAVSGSCDETLRIWNLESPEMLDFPEDSNRAVKCIVTSQDGRVAISNSDNTLRVWSLESGECIRILDGHTESVSSIVISEDGQTVASTSLDNTLRVWNLESGECLQVLEGLTDLMTWLSSSSSQRIVIADRRSFCIDDDTLRVWDLQSGECLAVLRHKGMVESLAVSAARQLAVSGKDNGSIEVWNLETYECIKVLEGHKRIVTCVAVSSDGHYAVSGSWDKTLRVWNLESGECIKVLQGHTGYVSVLALSADGRFVISGSKDKTLRVWNLKSGECVQILQGHHGEVSSVSVSADSRFAISESRDETLRIWNLESGECCAIIYARGMTKAAINWQMRKIIIGHSFNHLEFFKIENLPPGSHS